MTPELEHARRVITNTIVIADKRGRTRDYKMALLAAIADDAAARWEMMNGASS